MACPGMRDGWWWRPEAGVRKWLPLLLWNVDDVEWRRCG